MATTTRQQAAGEVDRSWVVVLSVGGLDRGMVGPFTTEGEAAAWVLRSLGGAPQLGWRIDPVVAPGPLLAAAAERSRRRCRLTVVR
ncbi:MAG: hypothetical protein KY447_10835 [Actinobacteria bacterium]|nr:hypothetical protein [Actinomycetota bacterium]